MNLSQQQNKKATYVEEEEEEESWSANHKNIVHTTGPDRLPTTGGGGLGIGDWGLGLKIK